MLFINRKSINGYQRRWHEYQAWRKTNDMNEQVKRTSHLQITLFDGWIQWFRVRPRVLKASIQFLIQWKENGKKYMYLRTWHREKKRAREKK